MATRFHRRYKAHAFPVMNREHSGSITIRISGQEPMVATALVTPEKRSRRYTGPEVRTVRERKATIESGLNAAFDSLLSAKLSTIVVVDEMEYAVEDLTMSGSAVTYSLIREGRRETNRSGYYGNR